VSRCLTAVVLFAVSTTIVPLAQAKSPCNTPSEVSALQFRQLQAELNVAALKCQGGDFDYAHHYNAFAEKARPALIENSHQLRALFARAGKGAGYIDRYSTGVFNEAQIKSQSIPDYCEDRARLMEKVSATHAHDLHTLAAQVVGAPYGGEACPVKEAAGEAKKTKKVAKKVEKKAG